MFRFVSVLAGVALLTGVAADDADARKRTRKAKYRTGAYSAPAYRGETTGECPCRGGNVCIGLRGGRYCITSGGNKRYGV